MGSVPTSFKAAYIKPTPLLKKPDLDSADPKSYRPIANLSVLSKLLERLVVRQLLDYWMRHGCMLPDLQSAYRAHHSTETAVTKVTFYWRWTPAISACWRCWIYQQHSTLTITVSYRWLRRTTPDARFMSTGLLQLAVVWTCRQTQINAASTVDSECCGETDHISQTLRPHHTDTSLTASQTTFKIASSVYQVLSSLLFIASCYPTK